MKSEIRKELLRGADNKNTTALRVIELIERLSEDDLELLILRQFYKELPYEYVKTKNPLMVVKMSNRLAALNTAPDSDKIYSWIVNYCQSKESIAPIYFDVVPMDQFLTFASLFNPQIYDDINALLYFGDPKEFKEFQRKEYGEPEHFKQMTATDLNKTIETLNEDGVVLEVQKKNRALFNNIIYIKPKVSILCPANVTKLASKRQGWFEYSVETKKAHNYDRLKSEYPIEIKAFEEIIAGQRAFYIRTEEPDYRTPFLRTYEFTKTIYGRLSEKGERMHAELKKELARKIKNNYAPKRPGMIKTDLEEMRSAPEYNKELDAMHGKEVECTVIKAAIINTLPDCNVLNCESAVVNTASAWNADEAKLNNIRVEIDPDISLAFIQKINYHALKFYGTVEYGIVNDKTELVIHVHSLSVIG